MFTISNSIPILCKTGIYADAKTGKKLIFDEEKKVFITDPEKKKPVKKKLAEDVYCDDICFNGEELKYQVYKAVEVNRQGLIFDEKPVFEATVGKEGIFKSDASAENFNYWNKQVRKDLVIKNVVSTDQVCRSLFCWPSEYILGDRSNKQIDEILHMAASGELKTTLKELENFCNQKFGLELEFTGISRVEAAKILSKFFKAAVIKHTSAYDAYYIEDEKERKWTVLRDSSINPQKGKFKTDDATFKCELVSPICSYGEVKTVIQPLIRELRKGGARINSSCGIHIHVDSVGQSAKSIRHLCNLVSKNEDMIFKALDVHESRIRYCKKMDYEYISRINNTKITNMKCLSEAWYNGADRSADHYDGSRYAAINLHSMFAGKGLEFRCFNSTLHAGRVRAYIEFCLALCGYAKTMQRSSHHKNLKKKDELKEMQLFLTKIGLKKGEFDTARLHLLANLKDKTV